MWPADSSPPGVRPGVLVTLALALVPAFAITAAVTTAYRAEQRRLAHDWFARGDAALEAHRPEEAVHAFRTALMFSREERQYRLRLAQALAADGRTTEARAHLLSLRDAQPGNAPVNLALGRLAGAAGDVEEAQHYSHAAIEGAWSDSAESRRRAARVELTRFLVARGARLQAQAELVTVQGNLPADRTVRHEIAGLMLEAGLASRAQLVYEGLLKEDTADVRALAGAGRAAYEQGAYLTAESLLSRAAAAGETDAALRSMLSVARWIVRLDPYQRRLSMRTRVARALQALDVAGTRATACYAASHDPGLAPLVAELEARRGEASPRASPDFDLVDDAMDLVFRIEDRAAAACGEPAGADRALLLLSRQRAGGPS